MGPFAALAAYFAFGFALAGALVWKEHPGYAIAVVVLTLMAAPNAKSGDGK